MVKATDYKLPVMDVENHPAYKLPPAEYKGLEVPAQPLEGGTVDAKIETKTKSPKTKYYDEG